MPQHPFDELTLTVARIKGLLLSTEKAERALEQLAEGIREAFPRSSGAGVSLLGEQGGRTSAGATDAVVLEADAFQYELGEGPCLTAWAGGRTVVVHDAATDDRWPLWSRAVGGLCIRSVISSPLISGTKRLGALKIYSLRPAAFDAATARALEKFTVPAATLLDSSHGSEIPHRFTEALSTALASRDTANRAQGVLMQRHGISQDRALHELVRLARTSGQPVDSISSEILSGTGSAGENRT